MTSTSLKKVFIANRGEIARRIAMSARKLGLETVTLYGGKRPPDFLRPWIDHWIPVLEDRSEVYLDAQSLVRYALESGCDCVHPGFGFLSENSDFAAQVVKAGLTWIGPKAESIAAMASKAEARRVAQQYDIPCVPGLQLQPSQQGQISDDDLANIRDFTSKHGFPILIKAALGGGGKGMRIVRHLKELDQQVQRAASEAMNSFADASLIVERYLENPRHVEIQVLADQLGHIVTVGDRDCSLQRRHQKVLEEAPAPKLHPDTRQGMHDAARELARVVGYQSAGTVEFLVDGSPDHIQKFYFLEMNTRLQVEHPVTEEVFGIDLVAWQFHVAMGRSLKGEIPDQPEGHSIEVRVYAEDPERNFFPSPGPVFAFIPPALPGIRWEIGIDAIDVVTSNFDPMIAKIVATGRNRYDAIQKLKQALKEIIFCGPPSNLELLQEILDLEEFQRGPLSTFYLSENLDAVNARLKKRKESWQPSFEEILDQSHLWLQAEELGQLTGHQSLVRQCFQKTNAAELTLSFSQAQSSEKILGTEVRLGQVHFYRQGQFFQLPIVRVQTPEHHLLWFNWEGLHFQKTWINESQASAFQKTLDSQSILAPVPGKIIKLLVSVGDSVEENQTLLVLESMKMEFEVKSLSKAVIEKIHVDEKSQVQADDLLISFED